MVDGRYRVTRGADGARYLHLFPPDGSPNWSLVLDTGESDELEVVVGLGGFACEEWSVDSFEDLLDGLEAAATPSPSPSNPEDPK